MFDPDSTDVRDLPNVPSPMLLRWVAPLVNDAVRHVWESLSTPNNSDEAVRDLVSCVVRRVPVRALVRITYRPLILELNLARLAGTLRGDTSSARFTSFADHLHDEGFRRDLWSRYPVAHDECVRVLEGWASNAIQLCRDYVSDLPLLERLFPSTVDLTVSEVRLGAGDTHHGGRSVSILELATPGEELIHKPRSGAPEVLFAELVDWVNGHGFEPELIATRALDMADHSWVRATHPMPCADLGEVRDYYVRLGAMIALCFSLSITDIHRGNIIAHGAFPVIVDLETIAHTQLRVAHDHQAEVASAVTALALGSVLSTGILPSPQLRLVQGETLRTDVSGMSANDKQMSAMAEPYFSDADMDTMHVSTRVSAGGKNGHLPVLDGQSQTAQAHEEAILLGFRRVYKILREHRHELLSDSGPLTQLPSIPVRHITGPTDMFSRFLWNSYHPDYLRDASKREQFLDRIFQTHEYAAARTELCESERAQLTGGDIPVFTATTLSTTLTGGDGAKIIGATTCPGLEQVRQRISRLSPHDLDYQQSVISGSLRSVTAHGTLDWPRAVVHDPQVRPTEDWLLAGAVGIGDYLLDTASQVGGRPYWLNYTLAADKYWMPQSVGDDLYSGASGIGLFLAYLGSVTGQERFTASAQSILDHTVWSDTAPFRRSATLRLGTAGSVDGLIYLASAWASLSGDPAPLTEVVETACDRLHAALEVDSTYDIIGGASGTILTLCAAYPHLREPNLVLDLVRGALSRLARGARGAAGDRWWPTAQNDSAGMLGFSHGASGIALAIARGAELVGAAEFDDLILGALQHERNAFDTTAGTWPDSHSAAGSELFAWCHGTPGVALARVCLPSRLRTREVEQDIELASLAMVRYYADRPSPGPPTLHNLSLCHGALGNLMIIDRLRRVDDSEALQSCRSRVLGRIRSVLETEGWVCGVPSGIRSVDLMTGVAGIGYGLLSARESGRPPSVLVLEAPGSPS